MTHEKDQYRIIFKKLEETDPQELAEVAEILDESEEIERLRLILLEIESPEPQSCTTI